MGIIQYLETGCLHSQRVTGVITFILFRTFMANALTKGIFGKEVNYDMMHQTLQHPFRQLFI